MPWTLTDDLDEYAATAGGFLRSQPVLNTVHLTSSLFAAAFAEMGDPAGRRSAEFAADRLSYGGVTLWEVGGATVSMAGVTRPVAGTVRVGPVYTPRGFRRRGYAGAVTAAVSQAALDDGAGDVVLYTDLANPTSNALYQRLGYRAVEDRVILSFGSGEQNNGNRGYRNK